MAETNSISCPSCGKPNPAGGTCCRFCAADFKERISNSWLYAGVGLLLVIAAIHFTASMTHRPRYTAIHELDQDNNFERVRVMGRIANISVMKGSYSNRMVRIDLEGDEVPAGVHPSRRNITIKIEGEPADDFLKMERPLSRGDIVDVAASVFAGEDYRHLSVSGPQFIRVLEAAPEGSGATGPSAEGVAVRQLLENPEAYRNRNIRVPRARIVQVSDKFPLFFIVDPGWTNAPLAVFGQEGAALKVGQTVSVRGRFVYYAQKNYWEIKTERFDKQAVQPAAENAEP